ncbi:MAG: PINc/VapC family ATPase [Candidatus Odinarchaeia archaeon]
MKDKRIVPDTSVIIDGWISKRIKSGELKDVEVIIPRPAIAEIEYQANIGRPTGFAGLAELKRLREYAREGAITLNIDGSRPTFEQIKLSGRGELDSLIRGIASENDALLVTSDHVQAAVAEAEGIKVEYIKKPSIETKIRIEDFFDSNTMSVHLIEGVVPKAKKGHPGNWRLVPLSDNPMKREEIQSIAVDIIERAKVSKTGFIEIDEPHATVVQFKNMRIVIAKPPFSDAFEVTAVRPIIKASLEDYDTSSRLMKRLEKKAEGILIAGPPGAGKSTFATALAEFYLKKNKIVKTMEKPRDLQVSQEIVQYSALEGDMAKTADLLLLVRPDYVIYDEMRKTEDFRVYADLRFSGVNMIGVVHSSKPIDALQRFIGRIELGLISTILDTIIFIEKGKISAVYSIDMTVKVPSGMTQLDLARPVIEVRDFETGELLYEIYTYGEQVNVVPVKRPRKRKETEVKEKIPTKVKIGKRVIKIFVPKEYENRIIRFYIDGEPAFTSLVGKNGVATIKKRAKYAKKLINAVDEGREIYGEV